MSLQDRIKSAFWKVESDESKVLHRISIKPFQGQDIRFDDDRVTAAITHHNQRWLHNEVVVRAKNATVEPQYAYAIDGVRTIIEASIRTPDHLPSPIPILKSQLLGDHENMDRAILFDGSMGANYAHFLSDVLPKLFLLEEFTDIDCPILVGPAVFDKSMVQFIMNDTELQKLNWYKLTRPVKVKELFIARPMPWEGKYWSRIKQLVIEQDQPQELPYPLFINRSGTRTILNYAEIKPILDEFGVTELAPEKLDMRGQAMEYNKATHIIGIHGAGMTNILFSNYGKVKVLELCSSNRIGTQFYWLATCLGINWDMMLGSEADENQSFTLDPVAFRKKLKKLLGV
jgi:capsular polysaccharide biosynthesis protein